MTTPRRPERRWSADPAVRPPRPDRAAALGPSEAPPPPPPPPSTGGGRPGAPTDRRRVHPVVVVLLVATVVLLVLGLAFVAVLVVALASFGSNK